MQKPSSSTATQDASIQRILVSVATYNESENIECLITRIQNAVPDCDILVVDDNSPDGTGEIVDSLISNNERIKIIHRKNERGLGTAILEGFKFAIRCDYEWIVTLDADLSHAPEDIPKLFKEKEASDVVVGSRYIKNGGIEGWPLKRHIMSRCINIYSRVLLGLRTKDTSGAFRCYRVSSLEKIDWSKMVSSGYSFMEEVLFRCKLTGCRIVEVPIIFKDRISGDSKINNKEALSALWCILYVAIRDRKIRFPFFRATKQKKNDSVN